MGFFSFPLAELVGPSGRVICVDLQERMVNTLRKKIRKKRLDGYVEARTCTTESLGIADLAGRVDFALAYHVLHETAQPRRFLQESLAALKPGGLLLLAEPKGHVNDEEFGQARQDAARAGFRERQITGPKRSLTLLLEKPAG
jgi:ubiquinone/menaquinone biosynthesis C-methylase UbiE